MRKQSRTILMAAGALPVLVVGAWAVSTAAPAPGDGVGGALAATAPGDGYPAPDAVWVVAHPGLQEPQYEGGRSGCRRCHLREYRSWEQTAHAGAYETLPEADRTNPDCVKCHVTGWGKPSGFKSIAETPELAGVGCEVCHGPGSLYKDREVMESREASIAAGLTIPDEQTCRGCHNEESPEFKGFNYEEALVNGVHERQQ